MTALQVVLLVLCVVGVAAGQIFFKLGAVALAGKSFGQTLTVLLLNPYILIGLTVYGLSTALWIWLLRVIPLNRAYPFMAFAFVLVPLAGWIFLGERVDFKYAIGVVFILAGLLVIGR